MLLFCFLAALLGGCGSKPSEPAEEAHMQVTDIIPDHGLPGDTIMIHGDQFGTDRTTMKVMFGSLPAELLSLTPTQITVRAPKGVLTAPITVRAGESSITTRDDFRVGTISGAKLLIRTFVPDTGIPGDIVRIDGEGFGDDIADIHVRFGSIPAAITRVTSTRMFVRVPQNVMPGRITIWRNNDSTTTDKDFSGYVPPLMMVSGMSFSNVRVEKHRSSYTNQPSGTTDSSEADIQTKIKYSATMGRCSRSASGATDTIWLDCVQLGWNSRVDSALTGQAIVDNIGRRITSLRMKYKREYSYNTGNGGGSSTIEYELVAHDIPYTFATDGTIIGRIGGAEILSHISTFNHTGIHRSFTPLPRGRSLGSSSTETITKLLPQDEDAEIVVMIAR